MRARGRIGVLLGRGHELAMLRCQPVAVLSALDLSLEHRLRLVRHLWLSGLTPPLFGYQQLVPATCSNVTTIPVREKLGPVSASRTPPSHVGFQAMSTKFALFAA